MSHALDAPPPGPRRHRFAGRRAAALLWLMAVLLAGVAHGACPSLPDRSLDSLDRQVSRDAKQALSEIGARLAALSAQRSPPPDQLAALYALQANAYAMLELDAEARQAASKGLALAPNPTDPVHVNLLTGYWGNIYDESGLDQAVRELEAARRVQPPDSMADVCLLITLGTVQLRRDRSDIAIGELTHAYHALAGTTASEQRVLAASALASVMRSVRDYGQSLALNQEVIDF